MQPKIIYKLNILCHIFHRSCKTSQRSEDSCVVTPGFRQLFSILFLSRFHPLLSLHRYDYFMCVSLSLSVCSPHHINWNLQRLIQQLVCNEMFPTVFHTVGHTGHSREGLSLCSKHWPLALLFGVITDLCFQTSGDGILPSVMQWHYRTQRIDSLS